VTGDTVHLGNKLVFGAWTETLKAAVLPLLIATAIDSIHPLSLEEEHDQI